MKKLVLILGSALFILFIVSSMSYQQQTIVPELRVILKDQPLYDELSKIEVEYWGRTISVETRGYFYFIEFLIRKSFHFIGFGCIGALFYLLFRKMKVKLATLLAVLVTFILASFDEYRQTFIEGRTGIFTDVLLDTAGAVTFVFLLKLFFFIKDSVRR